MTDSPGAYRILAGKHGYQDSLRYRRILEFLMTPDQAIIVGLLPAPAEEIAAKTGFSPEFIKAELHTLFLKGVVFPKNLLTCENPRFAREVMQLHDATQSILDLDATLYGNEQRIELFRLWNDFCENEWFPDRIKMQEKVSVAPYRVIPAYAAVKDISGLMPCEDMREILKAQQLRAVCSCSCRRGRTDINLACKHSHDVNCFQFNKGAEYAVVRGTGRELSYEEALALVDEIELDGLVHNWKNDRSMSSMPVMCNCCIDCCMIWHPVNTHGTDIGKYWAKSRFQAEIDREKCSGCRTCEKRCMFGAIGMVKVPGSEKLKAFVNAEKCYGCGVCVLKCKPAALSMITVRPAEHIPEAVPGAGH